MATLEEIQAAASDPEALEALLAQHVDEAKAGLLSSQERLLKEVKNLKPYRQLAEIGKTPEEIAEAVRRSEELAQEAERDKKTREAGADPDQLEKLVSDRLAEERERIRSRADEEARKEREARETAEAANKAMGDRLNRSLNQHDLYRVAGAIVEPDLWAEFTERLLPVMRRGEDGELQLVDPKTDVPLSGKKGDKTLEELVDELRVSAGSDPWNSRGGLFFRRGTGTGDHGDDLPAGKKRPPRNLKRSEMTAKDKTAFIREFGQDQFRRLPA